MSAGVVDVHGPIFDGRAEHALHDFMHEVVWEATKEARGDLGVAFVTHFREPTGYYESQLQTVRPVRHGNTVVARIHDDSVIYGWWLEGIGSRNSPVTSFRGYHSFRNVATALQHKAGQIAERVLRRFIGRMGGHHGP